MRDNFPLLVSSYLMVYACIQLVFQVLQVIDISKHIGSDINNTEDVQEKRMKEQQLKMIKTAQADKDNANLSLAAAEASSSTAPMEEQQLPNIDAYSIVGQDNLINNEEIVLLSGLDST